MGGFTIGKVDSNGWPAPNPAVDACIQDTKDPSKAFECMEDLQEPYALASSEVVTTEFQRMLTSPNKGELLSRFLHRLVFPRGATTELLLPAQSTPEFRTSFIGALASMKSEETNALLQYLNKDGDIQQFAPEVHGEFVTAINRHIAVEQAELRAKAQVVAKAEAAHTESLRNMPPAPVVPPFKAEPIKKAAKDPSASTPETRPSWKGKIAWPINGECAKGSELIAHRDNVWDKANEKFKDPLRWQELAQKNGLSSFLNKKGEPVVIIPEGGCLKVN